LNKSTKHCSKYVRDDKNNFSLKSTPKMIINVISIYLMIIRMKQKLVKALPIFHKKILNINIKISVAIQFWFKMTKTAFVFF